MHMAVGERGGGGGLVMLEGLTSLIHSSNSAPIGSAGDVIWSYNIVHGAH